jgi:hypothetical protein
LRANSPFTATPGGGLRPTFTVSLDFFGFLAYVDFYRLKNGVEGIEREAP